MKTLNIDKYDTIFFDLFHTLTFPGIVNYKINEWDIFNITKKLWSYHSIKTYPERGIGKIEDPEQIIKNILLSGNIPFDKTKVKDATKIRIEKFKNCLININENIIDTIKFLYAKNIKLCLVSNSDIIDKMGWDFSPIKQYFRFAIFSCDIGVLKPDKKIYQLALDKMKTIPEKSLFVGDGGSNEFKGAKLFNMETLMTTEFIKELWPEKIDEIKNDADYVVDKLNDIIK
ncbi:MAG: HAD family hydrolase [Spirochaetes bacterium]|nr:HAD family hydrolase [Spirochaetota bacterium]